MLNVMGDTLSHLASPDNADDGVDNADDEEDMEQGKLSKDDKPSWEIGAIPKTVRECMKSFQHKLMNPDELTLHGGSDTPNYCCVRDTKYDMANLNMGAVVQLQMEKATTKYGPTIFRKQIEGIDIIPK